MPGKDRQQTSESSTKASIASCGDAEDSVVPAHLIELGQQTLAEVTANVARGEPLVRCQLVASEFYEALKRELRPMSHLGVVERDPFQLWVTDQPEGKGKKLLTLTVSVENG
jgi:hypothetical protein